MAHAFRAYLLVHKVIAAAVGASAELAGDFRTAVGTGTGHRGNLAPTFGTFDDTHIYILYIRYKGAQAFSSRAPLD